MFDIAEYKSDNIIISDEPEEVDSIDWGYAHPNCDALFLDGSDYSKMKIVAFALNEDGNRELLIIKDRQPKLKLYRGVDEGMLSFGGGALL